MKISEIGIIGDLDEALQQVTPEDIERIAKRQLDELRDGDTPIGTLVSENTRQMWVAATLLQLNAKMTDLKAEGESDEITSAELKVKAFKDTLIANTMLALFWAQAASDLRAWKHAHVGVRKGWVLVEPPPSRSPFGRLMGGMSFPIGPEDL